MFISRSKFKTKSGKIYASVLLRESYRENGQVKKRTIANLTRCSEQEIKAIELALTHKHALSAQVLQESTNLWAMLLHHVP